MLAVFYRGLFINWWINRFFTQETIELSAMSMGADPKDIVIVKFADKPDYYTPMRFNENFEMVIYDKQTSEVEGETVEVLVPRPAIAGVTIFENGKLLI